VVRTSIGRRLGITGPLESADLGGIATMHAFARFLQPHLDTEPLPPAAVAERAAAGTGVYDWTSRSREELASARMDELFRWLLADRAGR
jgi:3-hydroxybutyryl-CoA dehydrogenase